MWDVAHEDHMNRDKKEVAYCQINAQMGKRICKNSSPDFFGSQLIIMRMRDPLVSETMFPRLATAAVGPLLSGHPPLSGHFQSLELFVSKVLYSIPLFNGHLY